VIFTLTDGIRAAISILAPALLRIIRKGKLQISRNSKNAHALARMNARR
jgi:hypothetical protein